MSVPADRRYSPDHHWVLGDGDAFRVGLTHFAQDALGDVTLVRLHDGHDPVAAGDELGEVEAFKAMSDLYMPVEATLIDRNMALDDTPSLVNTDPYGEGWICRIDPIRRSDIDALLDADSYSKLIGTGGA